MVKTLQIIPTNNMYFKIPVTHCSTFNNPNK